MRRHRYLILFVFSCLVMGFQCGEEYPEPEYSHIIHETLHLTPYKKAYNVGDTIWIGTNITGKYLYDSKVFKRVLIDSVSLPLQFSYSGLYKYPVYPVSDFVKAVHADIVEKRGPTLSFYYGCNQPDYNFKVGLVLLTPGIYTLRLYDQNYFSNCITQSRAGYSSIFYKFDLADCNKDVFLSIPPISRGGLTTDMMDAKEEFVVQVLN